MANSKPAYIFLGGVSHTPKFFAEAIKALNSHGYDAEAIAFPTCSTDTATIKSQKQWSEVDETKRVVSQYLDEKNKDVVLVLHSYGGWPGSRAVKGLDKESRLKANKSTGIVEVVFVAAFLLPNNAEKKNYAYLPPWLDVKDNCRRPNKEAVALLFSDLDEAAQQQWLSEFHWQYNDLVEGTLPDAPWELSVPKTYIVTTEDRTATTEFQLDMLKPYLDGTWSIKSLKSGHEPFLSQPVNFVNALLQPTF